MSLADQVTVTYVVVGIAVGLISWLATAKRAGGILILSVAAGLAGVGVEVLIAQLFGIYATFGSLDSLIGTSIVKSAAGAILTVALVHLGMRVLRPQRLDS